MRDDQEGVLAATQDAVMPPRHERTVMVSSFVLVLAFGIWGLAAPEQMTAVAVGIVNFVLESVGWLYLALCTGFLILGAWLAFGPYGNIRLGPDDSEPEFSTPSWLAMLFAGGMGPAAWPGQRPPRRGCPWC
jgi:choline-glycine betaine transporter